MSEVTVTAVQSFLYHGEPVNKGTDVTMPALDAAIEARKGNVTLVTGYRKKVMKAETPAEEAVPVRRRRNYRRRDMTAEP